MFTLHTTLGFNDINYLVLSKERLLKRKDINFPIEEKKREENLLEYMYYSLFLFYLLQPILEIG